MKPRLLNLEVATASVRPFLPQYLQEHGIDTTKNFRCIDPKHEDKDASMSMKQNPENAWCYGCNRTCDILTAAHLLEGKPIKGYGFIEDNLMYLAKKYGVQLELADLSEEEIYEYKTYEAYALAAKLVADPKFGDYTLAAEEIKNRGWDLDRVSHWGIGTVNFKDFRERLKQAGYEAGFLNSIDLDRSNLFNEDNLLFTVYDENGRPVGFSARNLKYKKEDKQSGPKYNNTRVTGLECNIFRKGERLYGLDIAKDAGAPLYIFEGQADVISARHFGYANCVCTLGSALTDHHIHLLKKYGLFGLVLVFDADQGGEEAIQKILDEKLSPHKEFRVKLIQLPQGMDPDQLFREKGAEEFARVKRWDAFEWRLAQFPDETDPEEIAKLTIPIILADKNYLSHEKRAKILAKRTGFDLATIMSEIKRQRSEREAEVAEKVTGIIENALWEAKRNPDDAGLLLTEAQANVAYVQKEFGVDSMGEGSVLSFVLNQKEADEAKTNEFSGFHMRASGLGNIARRLDDDWRHGIWMCIGGSPQAGKCLRFDSKVLLEDGTYKEIQDVVRDKDSRVITMDLDYKLKPALVSNWIDSGELECFEVKTSNGISTNPSETHPYFTPSGWKQVKDLRSEDRIAIAAQYTCFNEFHSPVSEEDAILLGLLLSDGSTTQSFGFSNTDQELISTFKKITSKKWPGVTYRENSNIIYVADPEERNNKRESRSLNWLKKYDLLKHNAHTKYIPDNIFRCSPKRIATFLGAFWACDGWVSERRETNSFEIGISLCNKNLLLQIRSLLLRFNIKATVSHRKTTCVGKEFDAWTLAIRDMDGARKFYNNIRIPLLYKQQGIERILRSEKIPQGAHTGSFPSELWSYIKDRCIEKGLTISELLQIVNPNHYRFAYDKSKDRYKIVPGWVGKFMRGDGITRRMLRTIGYVLSDEMLISLAEGDIYFDKIVSIAPIGKHRCYDLEVPGTHNFIAEDMVVHNTSLACQMAIEIAEDERNKAIVIYHSIDDAARFILFKMICVCADSLELTLGHVANPQYWAEKEMTDKYLKLREAGYRQLMQLITDKKIIIKDASESASLSYSENLVRYYKDLLPEKNIVLIIDNFHKLPDYPDLAGHERIKRISNHVKHLAAANDCTVITTVEYRKIYDAAVPTNADIFGSGSIEYDASAVLHLHNDIHVRGPEKATYVHEWNGEILPRIRVDFGKNKISGYEGTEMLDFFPRSATMKAVDTETARKDYQARVQFLRERRTSTMP